MPVFLVGLHHRQLNVPDLLRAGWVAVHDLVAFESNAEACSSFEPLSPEDGLETILLFDFLTLFVGYGGPGK